MGWGEVVSVRKATGLCERRLARASSNWPARDGYGEAGLALVRGLFLGGSCEGFGEELNEEGR